MLYVATTRAKEQLHIMLPNRKRSNNIGSLLLDMFAERMQSNGRYRHYEIGDFSAPEREEKKQDSTQHTVIRKHLASPVSLKLRTSASRYFADEEKTLSPRSMGILLHRVFEKAATREEIFATLEEMTINGVLSQGEMEKIKAQIITTLDSTIAGEWFDGSWEKLHNERNIIRPKGSTKRPDRVMTRGKEAVVVDYKFGEERAFHNRQIEEYMNELRDMGYSSVRGYIWYVSAGKIVETKAR